MFSVFNLYEKNTRSQLFVNQLYKDALFFSKGALLAKVVPKHQGALCVHNLSVSRGNLSVLAPKLKAYIEENAAVCQPDSIYVCDGSDQENTELLGLMERTGVLKALPKYKNK